MTAAECIRNVRLQMGKNQTEFAILIKKDKTSICMYEKGRRKPGFPTIREIVRVAKENGIDLKFTDLRDD